MGLCQSLCCQASPFYSLLLLRKGVFPEFFLQRDNLYCFQENSVFLFVGCLLFLGFVVLFSFCHWQRKAFGCLIGRRERKISGVMESTLKEMRNGESVLDMTDERGVGGGVGDIYGEDRATEDQLLTPWSFTIARLSTNV